jgi:hypothetical protein
MLRYATPRHATPRHVVTARLSKRMHSEAFVTFPCPSYTLLLFVRPEFRKHDSPQSLSFYTSDVFPFVRVAFSTVGGVDSYTAGRDDEERVRGPTHWDVPAQRRAEEACIRSMHICEQRTRISSDLGLRVRRYGKRGAAPRRAGVSLGARLVIICP